MSTEPKDSHEEIDEEGRRDFMKKAAVAGIAAGTVLGSESPVSAQRAGAKAVLPDGKALGREELLTKLGLDPSTPPEAWIVITSCDSNAAALKRPDAEKLLKGGKIKGTDLGDRHQELLKGTAAPRKQ